MLLSVEESWRIERRNREVLDVEQLSDADLEAIAAAKVPVEFNHLNAELEG